MPVTFVATSNKDLKRHAPGKPIKSLKETIVQSEAFEAKCDLHGKEPKKLTIVQTSAEPTHTAYSSRLGLLSTVLCAYNLHQDLVLDPNDVWITILAQFSAYVNGGTRAEQLRDRIVDFDGKKELTVHASGTLFTADFGRVAVEMVDEIAKNIKDPSLREWFLPGFSTTTTRDKIVAAVSCMSALQTFFEFTCFLMCGIPNVTLQGTPDDWKLLRVKIERLAEFDLEDKLMTKWLALLRPVCDNLAKSAEPGQADLQFWDRVCSHHGGGSGPSYLSGWITVFSVFKTDGTWQGECGRGGAWPSIDTDRLNHNVLSVPMKIDDNGTEYKSVLFAGQFVCEKPRLHLVRPRNDWAIAVECL